MPRYRLDDKGILTIISEVEGFALLARRMKQLGRIFFVLSVVICVVLYGWQVVPKRRTGVADRVLMQRIFTKRVADWQSIGQKELDWQENVEALVERLGDQVQEGLGSAGRALGRLSRLPGVGARALDDIRKGGSGQ